MMVQWCCKGIAKLGADRVRSILTGGAGIRCHRWTKLPSGVAFPIGPALRDLTEDNLDRHVHDYAGFRAETPFISLAAGCVERRVSTRTNVTHPALRTALQFATTDFAAGQRCAGWVFRCYVVMGMNPAVGVPGVAEEIRELNHGRAYSGWYLQGEVTAKINVPSVQIYLAERYEPDDEGVPRLTAAVTNPGFVHPAPLLNSRGML
ncbi:hypothetical protein GCM10010168_63270 [Actinoplanes ianthinogenes]|uniref:Uncharacterized protein n=1 Tax=Actinoplanes ianthinogenes TaxID=122358 RepID=A0ABM7LJK1_9ACTN|nr:hypothetical protein [Actinoplanes ianthinogenes]BCJ39425.1 hypothetical protein Aiant_00820 [Actinoplanes ianthinogenes]GGR36198.1 hypothetical protein GCM10010168_63270 [Actinoplanes ianthinogenes]